jgi:predicted phosphodiesterase
MRIAIISDIHEDIINLEKAFHKIEKLNCDKIYCLGDISGYGIHNYHYFERRNASECLKHVKNNCEIVVLGNHDLQAIQKIPISNRNFIFPKNWYNLDYQEKKQLSNNKLWLYEDELNPLYSKEDISFLKSKNEFEVIQIDNDNLLFSHYVYPNLTGSLKEFSFENGDYNSHFKFIKKHHCNLSFSGHEHADGLLIITEKGIIQRNFSSYKLVNNNAAVIVPAIVKGKKRSGFIIFDSDNSEIEAIKL